MWNNKKAIKQPQSKLCMDMKARFRRIFHITAEKSVKRTRALPLPWCSHWQRRQRVGNGGPGVWWTLDKQTSWARTCGSKSGWCCRRNGHRCSTGLEAEEKRRQVRTHISELVSPLDFRLMSYLVVQTEQVSVHLPHVCLCFRDDLTHIPVKKTNPCFSLFFLPENIYCWIRDLPELSRFILFKYLFQINK